MRNVFTKLPSKWANSLVKRTKAYRDMEERVQTLEALTVPPMGQDFLIELRDKSKFYVPNFEVDCIQSHLYKYRNYVESEVLKDLMGHLQDVSVILDVGANIGNHSVYWAKQGCFEKIHAFEPVVETFKLLQRNIAANNADELVTCYNFGLGRETSNASIQSFDPKNIGGTKIQASETGELAIRSLDEMAAEIGGAQFMKIDVEGFELAVLEGGGAYLRSHKPMIFIETFPERRGAVFSFLNSIGYSVLKEYPDSNYLLSC